MLIIFGCVLGFYGYAQDQSQDAEIESEEDIFENVSEDSLESGPDEQNLIIDNAEAVEDNSAGFALPLDPYYNEDDVYDPSEVTGNPGPAANGAYDVDGKINGDLDAKEPTLVIPENNTRNPQADTLEDSTF